MSKAHTHKRPAALRAGTLQRQAPFTKANTVISFGPGVTGDAITMDDRGTLRLHPPCGVSHVISPAEACRRIARGVAAHHANGDDLTFVPVAFVRLWHLLASELEAPAWRITR